MQDHNQTTTVEKTMPEESLAFSETEQYTDIEIGSVIVTVEEMKRKQDAVLLGKEGWLHVESELFIPSELKGNGGVRSIHSEEVISIQDLYPDDTLIINRWYYVDSMANYNEAMEFASSPDGVIRQHSVMADGRWVNITLKTAGFHKDEYETAVMVEKVMSPTADVLNTLKKMVTWENINVQTHAINGQYEVVVEQRFDNPIEKAVLMPEPVIGSRFYFRFDEKTGQLLVRKAETLLQSGAVIITEQETYQTVQYHAELPAEIAVIFESAVQNMEE
jgi:hypothetical protein